MASETTNNKKVTLDQMKKAFARSKSETDKAPGSPILPGPTPLALRAAKPDSLSTNQPTDKY